MLQFAPAGKQNEIELARFLLRDVAAAEHAFAPRVHVDFVQDRHRLTREREQGRAVDALQRGDEGARGFLGIGGTNDIELRNDAQAATVSTGSCVGPSSPTPIESCVKM